MQILVELSEVSARGKGEEEGEGLVLKSEEGQEALAKLNSGGNVAGTFVCLLVCLSCVCV